MKGRIKRSANLVRSTCHQTAVQRMMQTKTYALLSTGKLVQSVVQNVDVVCMFVGR